MTAPNEFPKRPIPAVGVIVFRGDGVLLVKRGSEPNRGRWSVPGGTVEVGETVEEAAVRETLEETGVGVRSLKVFDVRNYIDKERESVRWHYVLIEALCEYVRGEPFPASDAQNARFIPFRELVDYEITPSALDVLHTALATRGGPQDFPSLTR